MVSLSALLALSSCAVFSTDPGSNAGTGFIETTWNLAYLGPNFVKVHRDPLVSPAYSKVLDRFPATYINCGGRDALLPQSFRFAKCLVDAGVETTVSIVGPGDHEFLLGPDYVPGATEELDRMIDWMRLQDQVAG